MRNGLLPTIGGPRLAPLRNEVSTAPAMAMEAWRAIPELEVSGVAKTNVVLRSRERLSILSEEHNR